MTCSRCRQQFAEDEARCPHCGQPNPEPSGMFQTSTVLISSGDADLVYRSVEEVPARLRTRLIESTNSANSGTILIADRRGRAEIIRALNGLPSSLRSRLATSLAPAKKPATAEKFEPAPKAPTGVVPFLRRNWLEISLPVAVGLIVWAAFNYR